MQRTQALKRLERLINELRNIVHTKNNIHKENCLGCVTPEKSSQAIIETVEAIDTEVEGDSESVTGDKNENDTRPGKRKDWHSPDPAGNQIKKNEDSKPSPPQ